MAEERRYRLENSIAQEIRNKRAHRYGFDFQGEIRNPEGIHLVCLDKVRGK